MTKAYVISTDNFSNRSVERFESLAAANQHVKNDTFLNDEGPFLEALTSQKAKEKYPRLFPKEVTFTGGVIHEVADAQNGECFSIDVPQIGRVLLIERESHLFSGAACYISTTKSKGAPALLPPVKDELIRLICGIGSIEELEEDINAARNSEEMKALLNS